MPVRVRRDQTQPPKVVVSDGNEKAKIPSYQYAVGTQSASIFKIDVAPPPPSDAFVNGKTILMDLKPMEVSQIIDLELQFQLSCSTANVELVPSPHFIKKITIEEKLGDQLAQIYPESILAWMYITNDKRHRKRYQRDCGFIEVTYESEGTSKYWSNADNNTISVGETRYYTLPIPIAFFKQLAIDGRHISNGMRFRIELSNDVVVSGSSSNLSLDNLSFIAKSVDEDNFDVAARADDQHTWAQKYIYLDVERTTYNDKTLTASTETKYDLSSFQGKSPCIMVVIKNSTQQASDKSRYDFYEAGPNAKFDLVSSSGASQLGNGTPVSEDFLYKYFVEECRGPAPKGCIFIPFSEPGQLKKAFGGIMAGGYREFIGQKDQLAVTFDAAGTAEVHTIAVTNAANDGGFYRVATTKGEISNKSLAHNAAVGTIKSDFEALNNFSDRNLTVTVANTLASGSDPTVTFDANRDGPVSREIGVATILPTSLNDGGVGENITSSTVTTRGKRGWSSGSSYSTEIYLFKFRELTIDQMGRIHARDI